MFKMRSRRASRKAGSASGRVSGTRFTGRQQNPEIRRPAFLPASPQDGQTFDSDSPRIDERPG